jgi:hypothetical protein
LQRDLKKKAGLRLCPEAEWAAWVVWTIRSYLNRNDRRSFRAFFSSAQFAARGTGTNGL